MPEAKPLNLIQKCAAIMGAVHSIPKNGRNSFHNYDYATEADINAGVRQAMAAQGVMLIPSVDKLEWREVETKNGKERIATLTVTYTLTDGTEERHFTIIGEGQDRGDKATYKAMTGAGKYALLKLFLIPTGDDPENDGEAAPPAKTAPKSAPPKPPETPKRPSISERKAAVSRALHALGYTDDGIKVWVPKVLGHAFDSTTTDDIQALENEVSLQQAERKQSTP